MAGQWVGDGKTVLITGASSGIGLALADVFAANGYDLIITARRKNRLQDLADTLFDTYGATVTVVPADLADADGPGQLVDAIAKKGLAIDVLVNNAGFGQFAAFNDTDRSTALAMLQVNIVALTELTHRLTQTMIEQGGGRILNVASVAGFTPTPHAGLYGATKAFVLSFSEALHDELSPHGISVTALCPGLTKTEFSDVATGNDAPDEAQENAAVTSLLPGFIGETLSDAFILKAEDVARDGFNALHRGQAVAVSNLTYELGLSMMRLQPRTLARTWGAVMGKALGNGF
ncbi:MAG: SDR family oxidoreductase [Pseudomonadota bacterium]